jgi:hypothetical protein
LRRHENIEIFTSTRPEDLCRPNEERCPSLNDGNSAVVGCSLVLIALSVDSRDLYHLDVKRYPSHEDEPFGMVCCRLAVRFHLVAT